MTGRRGRCRLTNGPRTTQTSLKPASDYGRPLRSGCCQSGCSPKRSGVGHLQTFEVADRAAGTSWKRIKTLKDSNNCPEASSAPRYVSPLQWHDMQLWAAAISSR